MAERIKIGVNGWFFTKPYTGIGRYCLNVFPELAIRFPQIEFIIPISTRLDEEVDKNLRYLENLRFELLPENLALKSINPGLSKSAWETWQLGKFFKNAGVDLIHLPYPALYNRRISTPVVLTIHDTIPWTDKQYSHRGLLSSLYNKNTLKLARKADCLLTVSEASKKEVHALPGFAEKKLDVIYNATEFNDAPDFSSEKESELLEKLGIREKGQYLFYMGGFDYRKNVQRLVDVFRKHIAPQTNLKLVLGGGTAQGKSLFDNLYHGEGDVASRIIETGFLTNRELILLYRRAWAFVTLTTREGFDLPLLESLTLGCPALVSDLPVHHEVANDVPLFLDLSLSDRQIADLITNLYNEPRDYEDLKKQTVDFSSSAEQKYSWQKTAEQIGNIYLKLIQ
jgi:glycosyltransferase involved in cell wall biosynthesis